MMRPVDGDITTDFFEERPLAVVEQLKNQSLTLAERETLKAHLHLHAAIDIGASVGAHIVAPERGEAFVWAAFRLKVPDVWPDAVKLYGEVFPFNNYFYDVYGAIIVLRSADTMRTHLIAHQWINQAFNKGIYEFGGSYEEARATPFPLHAFYSKPKSVKMGDLIGYVGNAGTSTGAHIHWEIHHGYRWNWWDNRIDPERWG